MPGLPTGTVTFLFTDIEGSTTLLQRLGDRRYAEILAEHRRLLREAFAEGYGQEIDTQGDAFLVAFSRARDAVATAVAAQRALTNHTWPDGASLRVRMGLHTGEPVSETGGYVGLDVHRAARICSAGHGGQILLSDSVSGLAARDLPPGVSLRDLGTHFLKDLCDPEHLLQVVHPDLSADFPPLKSLAARSNNLPIQLTSFVGREREIAAVKGSLSTARIVTLTGTGGAGKTRLALQVAAELLQEYPDGVWLAQLAPLSEPALVPKAVASALNIPEQPGRPLTDTVVEYLRPKALLLVLDNCEHVLEACAHLATALLQTCPHLRIVATSREALGIAGELTHRVPSLSLPDPKHLPPPEMLTQYEAVRLFAERAAFSKPGFRITSSNAGAVAQVTHRLDGIPLAIELAAARVKVLALDVIAAKLDDQFRLLTGGSRSALPRHQTLRAALDWGYDLLSEQERMLFRRLSVFAGGFTLETAEQICGYQALKDGDILDLLTRLVDKSLVMFDEQDGLARYRLLEPVRQYGRDRLVEAGEAEEVRRRHRDWFLVFAEQAEPNLRGPEPKIWLERLEREYDNLRAALEWSRIEAGGAEAGARQAAALSEFWRRRGHLTEGRGWLQGTLAEKHTLSPSVRAKALHGAGVLALAQSDYAPAQAVFEESLAISRRLPDARETARLLYRLARVAYFQDEQDRATALCGESLTIFREVGDRWGIAASLETLGRIAWRQGDYGRARRLCEESLAVARDAGDKMRTAVALNILSLIAMHEGDCGKAVTLQEESLALLREVGDKFAPDTVGILGCGAYYQGNYQKASTLLEEALAMSRELGYQRGIGVLLQFLGRVARAQGDYVRAMKMQKESLTILRDQQEKFMILQCLDGLAGLAISQNQPERATRLFGATAALRELNHIPLPPVEQPAHGRDIAAGRAALGESSFGVAWAEGRAMTLEQAIEYALAVDVDHQT